MDVGNGVLQGKKLLILAGGPHLVDLVKRAKDLGVYTIVTDYYDAILSPAKLAADEYWDISWSDLDTLEIKCRQEKIDGITTGYSETPLGCCIKLCERLGLPCYCTAEQLERTSDKILFKELCKSNGVPTVKQYESLEGVTEFPVIIKPVDRAGSIGVNIATNHEELCRAYHYAMEKSYSKNVIIEKYITGTKIDVYYEIRGGVITLLTSDDVINAERNGLERVVQSSWLFPSRYHDRIICEADPALRRLIRDLGINDGYIFISGFEEQGEFMFFEAGFRLCGGHIYKYLEKKGMENNQDLFIWHALTGSTQKMPHAQKAINEKLKCVDINIYAKEGIIADISGMDKIASMKDCYFALTTGLVGQDCKDKNAILDKIAMYYFCHEDSERLQEDVEKAYTFMQVTDVSGKDMIYDRIDTSKIRRWWE